MPGENIELFNDYISKTLNKIKLENKKSFYMGDYNINLLNSAMHPATEEFVNINLAHGFIPTINKPTRITSTTATLIDNIFTNETNLGGKYQGIIPTDLSDHLPIFHIEKLDKQTKKNEKEVMFKRIFSERNKQKFTNLIGQIDMNSIELNLNAREAYSTFQNALNTAFEDSFPLIEIKKGYKDNLPWLTEGLKSSIKIKNRLYVLWYKNKTQEAKTHYSKYKLILNKMVKKAQRDYYKQQIEENRDNLYQQWAVLKAIINKKKNSNKKIGKFKINGILQKDPQVISNAFVDYFTDIGENLDKKIPKSSKNPLEYIKKQYTINMFMVPVTIEEVNKIISDLKTCAPGWDHIPSKLLKENTEIISPTLTHLINISFLSGIFPDELKLASLVPIYKAGDSEILGNYRPVSLLSTLSKVFERSFYTRLSSFLEEQKILYENQFGFRKRHSTYMANLILMNKVISSIEKNEFTIGVYLDFSKAFDTVNHSILLKKLEHYGIRGLSNNWIEDYLSNRKQFAVINGIKSKTRTIKTGVPQGSILGPLLFLLYINDMEMVSEKLQTIIFADDTNIFLSGPNIKDLTHILNTELTTLAEWLTRNRLSLNIKKTHFMVFKPKRNSKYETPSIEINNEKISEVKECKFLGVMLDNELNWKAHCNYIKNKLSKSIGILSKARKVVDKSCMKTLYYSFIHPYLLYSNITWGNSEGNTLWTVFKIQKIAIRLMGNLRKRDSTSKTYKELKILKLPDLYTLTSTLFMWDYIHHKLPDPFTDFFTTAEHIHNHNTRNRFEIRTPGLATKIGCKFIVKTGPKLWADFKRNNGTQMSKNQTKK